jgi:hypothetical protein
VTGNIGVKEIERLIKKLELDKESFGRSRRARRRVQMKEAAN